MSRQKRVRDYELELASRRLTAARSKAAVQSGADRAAGVLGPAAIRNLQRTAGNQAVTRLLRSDQAVRRPRIPVQRGLPGVFFPRNGPPRSRQPRIDTSPEGILDRGLGRPISVTVTVDPAVGSWMRRRANNQTHSRPPRS
jgi:hypothetical protein